ncbi:hypothetical protein KXW36_000563, partial [Aspergillus fumigatus]
MATIGTFKKTGSNEFTGEIVTLSVQAKGVRIVPDTRATGENAPSHRVLVGRADYAKRGVMRSEKQRRLAQGEAPQACGSARPDQRVAVIDRDE